MENLLEYFEKAKGLGILGTADKDGKVNAALYAKPHFMEDGTIAFIMADRLTHRYIQANSKAVYLFVEKSEEHYSGKRLYLTRVKESEDLALIEELRRKRKCKCSGELKMEKSFLVYFQIDSVLPLVGDKE